MSGPTRGGALRGHVGGRSRTDRGRHGPGTGTGAVPGVIGSAADILALQRTAGNRAVDRLLRALGPPAAGSVVRGAGEPLDPTTRTAMEDRLGHDFRAVRVHTGSKADDSARALNAKAYTVGSDLVFSRGRYAPGTAEGERLLAHELAHVVQQTRGGRRTSGNAGEAEREAEAAGASAGGRGTTTIHAAVPVGVQCQPEDDSLASMESYYFGGQNPSARANLAKMIEGLGGFSYDAEKVPYRDALRQVRRAPRQPGARGLGGGGAARQSTAFPVRSCLDPRRDRASEAPKGR